MKSRSRSKSDWPLEIKSGSAVVKIYQTRKASGYTSYPIVFYKGHERKVRFFQDLDAARTEAKRIADDITQGQHITLELTATEQLTVHRALEILAPLRIPIDVAAARFADAQRTLNGTDGDVVSACKEYAKLHVGIVRKNIPDAVNELLLQIEAEQKNTLNGTRRKVAWAKVLRSHLNGKLARDFSGDVSTLTSDALEPWLIGLKCSERTRRNIRDCISYFIRWAKGRNYLTKDADPLENVQNFRKRKLGAVEVITAEQLGQLFAKAPEDFIPYLALRAFAGLRDSEARMLEWQHIDLRARWIDIPEQVAKQSDDEEGVRRMVKIRPVLLSWLRPRVQQSGRVCPYENSVKKLGEVAANANVDMPRNALRHSFISAAVTLTKDLNAVAMEAGNSPQVIRQHYWRKMRPKQAREWFKVACEQLSENKSEKILAFDPRAKVAAS